MASLISTVEGAVCVSAILSVSDAWEERVDYYKSQEDTRKSRDGCIDKRGAKERKAEVGRIRGGLYISGNRLRILDAGVGLLLTTVSVFVTESVLEVLHYTRVCQLQPGPIQKQNAG